VIGTSFIAKSAKKFSKHNAKIRLKMQFRCLEIVKHENISHSYDVNDHVYCLFQIKIRLTS